MATSAKPWNAEYAKSGRSKCQTCKTLISEEELRLGKEIRSKKHDGFMTFWNHATCIVLKNAKQIKSCDVVEGIDTLRWEDQEMIRQYVAEGDAIGSQSSPDVTKCTIEASKTDRATCKRCNEKIMTGEVRISSKAEGQGTSGLAWHHAKCFMDSSPSTQPENMVGWGSLSDSDKSTLLSMVNKVSPAKKGKNKVKEDNGTDVKSGSKRKGAIDRDHKSKIAKTEDDPLTEENSKNSNVPDSLLLLKAQTDKFWSLRDDLKKHVTSSELRKMLETNNQDSSGLIHDLLDRCSDGMLFGPLKSCVLCSGHLHYSGGTYKCKDFLTEHTKCAYSTSEPERVEGKWNIPRVKIMKKMLSGVFCVNISKYQGG